MEQRAIAAAEIEATKSLERVALAAAIRRHNAALERLAALEQANPKAADAVYAALSAVEHAEHHLAEARTREPKRLADRLLGIDPPEGELSVERAEAALATTQRELELARRSRSALEEQQRAATAVIEVATRDLKTAVSRVVAPSPQIAKLMAEWHRTKQHITELRGLIEHLAISGCLPDSARNWEALPAQDAVYFAKLKTAVQPWQAAIQALAKDADAPLPQP